MNLIETTIKTPLPLLSIVVSSILTKISKGASTAKNKDSIIMNEWTQELFNKLDSLKFLSYIDESGHPIVIPLLQCQASDSKRLVFHLGAFKEDLIKIKPNTDVAVLGLTLAMEDVLTRGKFLGFKRHRGIKLGLIDVEWIYNSMPPMPGQIYPEVEVKRVVESDY